MRPGRLDKLLYVGIAQHKEDKMKVLQALTRKFTLAPSVNLDVIAQGCATNLTGADLYALCADAWMVGLRRTTATKVISCRGGRLKFTSQGKVTGTSIWASA